MSKQIEPTTSRRGFIETGLATAALLSLRDSVLNAQDNSTASGIPARPLGKTGEKVSIICLGGWHIGRAAKDSGEADAIKIMHRAIDEGVTFWDNAWDYHDGYSEELMGRGLKGRRDRVFLMTKNCERDYEGSKKNLDDSLRRLGTDRLDLWQFHEMVYDNDPDWVFDKGGFKAAMEAVKAGKVRYVGFTGHKDPLIHLKMLSKLEEFRAKNAEFKNYEWASAQMPINLMDAHYRSFQKHVVPECLKRGVGVLGMKGLAGGHPKGRIPDRGLATAAECRRFALSLPITSLVCGIISMKDLEQDVAVARNFKPYSMSEIAALVARVRDEATDGRHELFKSTKAYDGPHHRKQHGFDVEVSA
jgi:aryl-alcohol dehydrogenase-like predicted oxidoreductase